MKMWKINKRTLPNKLVPLEKNPKINKRTGTFIWHYRVLQYKEKCSLFHFTGFKGYLKKQQKKLVSF